MDITDLRIIAMFATLITFLGILVWAWSTPKKQDFDEAANLPFQGEE